MDIIENKNENKTINLGTNLPTRKIQEKIYTLINYSRGITPLRRNTNK